MNDGVPRKPGIPYQIGPKVQKQMARRGWSIDDIKEELIFGHRSI
jgi:hypothetical protein